MIGRAAVPGWADGRCLCFTAAGAEAGVEEGRELFWKAFGQGKVFAQRQSFFDALFTIIGGRDRDWLGMLLQLVVQVGAWVCVYMRGGDGDGGEPRRQFKTVSWGGRGSTVSICKCARTLHPPLHHPPPSPTALPRRWSTSSQA